MTTPKLAVLRLLGVVAVLAFGGLAVSPAAANEPWWHLTSTSRPSVLSPDHETKGEIVVTAINLGDASANGEASPIRIEDVLPKGLEKLSVSAFAVSSNATRSGLDCHPGNAATAPYCELRSALAPYAQIEMRVSFLPPEEGPLPSAENVVKISGGSAPAAQISRPLSFGSGPVPFGLAEYDLSAEEEGGAPDTTAASHPFQLTTTLVVNQKAAAVNHVNSTYEAYPVTPIKDIRVALPVGLIGNPTPLTDCTYAQFFGNPNNPGELCPQDTVVGVAVITIDEPILNGLVTFKAPIVVLPAPYGEAARFGFGLPDTPIYIDATLRDGENEGESGEPEYGIIAGSLNTSETASFIAASVTLWGAPGAAVHNPVRGVNCLEGTTCEPLTEEEPAAFMTMPTSCSGSAISSVVEVNSWAQPFDTFPVSSAEPLPALERCSQVPFAPTIHSEPTSNAASTGSGLSFDINVEDEGLTSSKPEARAQSQINRTVVTLPEGFTSNPSLAAGLKACSEAEYEAATDEIGTGCTEESKIGTVEVESPLVAHPLVGSLYVAQQVKNPFGNLLTFYMVFRNPELGIIVKQPIKITPNQQTGQLVAEVQNIPQLPFAHFRLSFRSGQRSPLVTPAFCGTYAVKALLFPWSDPTVPLEESSSFQITQGAEGQSCPSDGQPPFHPTVEAGTLNNAAGAYSPFYARISRKDSEQEITHATITMPPGLSGKLTGVAKCSDASIEAAKALERVLGGGQSEEEHPSCPAGSEIGHTLVGTGVGTVLAYVPGKLYLAGPYKGAPLSVVSITAAKVGPFDIGTVVIRFGLIINPLTAQVEVNGEHSDPIPHIVDGIVVHVRTIRVYVSRPEFTFNPTSCKAMSITGTIGSAEEVTVAESSRFQAANCSSLAFAPKFSVSTSAHASKANGASLNVKLSYPSGSMGTQAWVKSVKVELPKALPSRLTTLQKACTAKAFESNPASCPPESVIGRVIVHTEVLPVPLEGPAYFVSHGGEAFPSLIVVLQGYGVTIDLVGDTFIDEKTGITSSTFKETPDVPFETFELTLPQGEYSALAAHGNLCQQKLVMPTAFVAQNGATLNQETRIEVEGCSSALSVVSKKVKGRTIALQVAVPAGGKLTAGGKGLSSTTKSSGGRETVTIKLRVKPAKIQRASLQRRRGRGVTVHVELSFKGAKGKPLTESVPVAL